MHESVFCYTLTKPYPYRWFTWVVVLGGIAATALFSVISVAANGFEITTLHVINPNDTEYPRHLEWYQKRPWSFASKIVPKCEDQIFSLTSKIFTNNLLLSYEIGAVRKMRQNEIESVASFAYHNDFWQNCRLTQLAVDLANPDAPIWMNASVSVNCTVFDNYIPTTVLLKATYNHADFDWADLDPRTQPSLWWAQTLLGYQKKDTSLSDVSLTFDEIGLLLPESAKTKWIMKIDGTDSNVTLHVSCGLSDLASWSSTWGPEVWKSCQPELDEGVDFEQVVEPQNISSSDLLSVMYMDANAKLIYSLVLTDLGQASDSNMLADPRKIWGYLNATMPYLISTQYTLKYIFTGGTRYAFDDTTSQDPSTLFTAANLSLPHVNNATISTEYQCEIPKQKPMASLAFSVIVADLVFLQTLWIVFTWAVKFVIERHDLSANQCSKCMDLATKEDGFETVPQGLAKKHSNSSMYRPLPSLPSPSSSPSEERASSIRRRPVPAPSRSMMQAPNETTIRCSESDGNGSD